MMVLTTPWSHLRQTILSDRLRRSPAVPLVLRCQNSWVFLADPGAENRCSCSRPCQCLRDGRSVAGDVADGHGQAEFTVAVNSALGGARRAGAQGDVTAFQSWSGSKSVIAAAMSALWAPRLRSYTLPHWLTIKVMTPDSPQCSGYATNANPAIRLPLMI